MAQRQQQGAASAAPITAPQTSAKIGNVAFDPAIWLAAWSDHGGIAMLVGDRLWVSRLSAIDRGAATALDTLRGHLHRPGAPDALAGLLRANAGGMR